MNFNNKRFYYPIILGDNITLYGPEHHHLANVSRCKLEEKVTVFNGDAYDYTYEIVAIQRDETKLKFISKIKNTKNPTVNLTVFLGLIKLDNLALVVEKLTEIGVTKLVPFVCGNSNIGAKTIRVEKLTSISAQSCKQCGRSIPIQIENTLSFQNMISVIRGIDMVYYADLTETANRITRTGKLGTQRPKEIAIIIGPEGGFTKDETIAIKNNSTPITLGARTLRSETAAIVGATLVLNLFGEI
ncbi:MAG: 16S rRNA (uracil(1498)-N(3))-methyltransferase [Firmicutes bacterium]|nr:16S rRNA (uracil(1498)-N(3))-methyltransferase [Bacillota bacterium]